MDPDDGRYDWVPAYDISEIEKEPRPDHAIYQQPFSDLKEAIKNVAAALLEPLERTQLEIPVVAILKEEIERQTTETYSVEAKFIVVGDMGSGKSSAINSILGLGSVARIGADGGSCTWVTQQFMKMFPGQDAPFAARVYFFSSKDIEALLKSNLARFYRANNRSDVIHVEEDQEGLAEDYNDRKTVLDAFMPLFADHEEFESRERATEFLSETTSDSDENMLSLLMSWAVEVVNEHLMGNDFIYVSATTPFNLVNALQPYTHALEDGDEEGYCQPWLLVRSIEFGLDSPILNAGIVLVDAPGRWLIASGSRHSEKSSRPFVSNVLLSLEKSIGSLGRTKWRSSLRCMIWKSYTTPRRPNWICVDLLCATMRSRPTSKSNTSL
jgi:hypothetical protein